MQTVRSVLVFYVYTLGNQSEASLIERTEFSFLHVPQYILKWRILDEASWQKCFLSHTTLPCVGDNTSFSR